MAVTQHIIGSLRDLHTELEPVIAQWRQLGEQLNVPDHALRTISAYGGDNPEDCITEVLTRWTEQKTHTWRILIDAIANTKKSVQLVEELQRKYHGASPLCDNRLRVYVLVITSIHTVNVMTYWYDNA